MVCVCVCDLCVCVCVGGGGGVNWGDDFIKKQFFQSFIF